jgi:glycosyltransferase involved in cell wall biosynthesis
LGTLSIIIPAYNEENSILGILERIHETDLNFGLAKEIILVDDKSTDNTIALARKFKEDNPQLPLRIIEQKKNHGKGAALRKGIREVLGDYVIIQDADLEYDPREYNHILKPMVEGHADVVYGSRFKGNNPHRILFFWHSIGNKLLTSISNMLTNLNLSDMETCYKCFKREIIQGINLKENRFGFEPEVTAKISRIKNIRIYEVGISYYGRTYEEGKKIGLKDALRALYCMLKYNIWAR